MITVLFVGMALVAISTTAGVSAVQQLRQSADDSRGARSVAYAEAGLQRFLSEVKSGRWNMSEIVAAGCNGSALTMTNGVIGDGRYSAYLTVYNPALSPPVPAAPYSSGSLHCAGRSTGAKVPQLYAVTSTGTAQTGSRTIRSVVTISGTGLPLGVFVRNINANGTGNFTNISLLVRGDVYGREKMGFTGDDLALTQKDVYCDENNNQANVTPVTPCPAAFAGTKIKAAVHATGTIYAKQNGKSVEFPPNPNCSANGTAPVSQSLWDGSGSPHTGNVTTGCTGQVGNPPTSRFTDKDLNRLAGRSDLPSLSPTEYAALKSQAQTSGIYCDFTAGSTACTRAGSTINLSAAHTIRDTDLTGLTNFVAYFDFPAGSTESVKWNAAVGPCNSVDPALNRSATIVARNGGITFRANNIIYGAVIAPEGTVDAAGSVQVIGPVMANQIVLRGTATFKLDACAVTNTPTGVINVSGGRWSEVDR